MDRLEKLNDELMALSAKDRGALATFLLDSLDTPGLELSQEEWEAEISRRTAEIRAGTAVGHPADEVIEELRKKYG